MLQFLIIITGIVNTCRSQTNTGTTLFNNKQIESDCWNEEELAKLRARMVFNQLLPQPTAPDKVSKKFINDAIRYYRRALRTVDKQRHSQTKTILKETLLDTLGGHMRSELLPTARFAFYAGYVPYKQVRELHEFYDELKMILNTQGQGWKRPAKVPQIANLTVVKIMIGPGKLFFNPCNSLVTQRDTNSCIRLPTPRVDDDSEPSAIALPFKHGGLVNLVSPKSENILLKYYTTAARCILSSSPESCRHPDFVNFNNDFWHWMKRDVAPHLMDEKLYTAYGGVFRIAAAVQNYGRGLSRRNLFEFYPSSGVSKWQPWKVLTQSYVAVNSDWSPGICVTFVVLAALVICFLQFLFNYLFTNDNGCHCVGTKMSDSKEVAYANIESNFPNILGSDIYGGKTKSSRRTVAQSKVSSIRTVKTEKVYDLHENTEQLMDIVMSDAEGENSSNSNSDGEDSNEKDIKPYLIKTDDIKRSKSPPKIEPSIAQLKINKGRPQLALYSSSTVEGGRAARELERERERWAWSEPGSSSGDSASSGSSSGSRRNLAWAHRLLSNHSRPKTRTTSGTELTSHR